MGLSIFDYTDYRTYLIDLIRSYPRKGHGVRSTWAQAIGCNVAFVSHVLRGRNDFSCEQAESLSRHIALNKEEAEFLLLLLQRQRAGTHQLKRFFEQLIADKLEHRQNIRGRMKIKENLSLEDQTVYYSKWLYSAVHVLLTIPEYQVSPEKVAAYFNEPLSAIREILEFLEARQLIQRRDGRYIVQNTYMFINRDSPLFSHQQSFWRQKATESAYQNKSEDIHFASIFTLSKNDIRRVKELLLKSIEQSTEVIKPSKEERLYSICLDFFEVR